MRIVVFVLLALPCAALAGGSPPQGRAEASASSDAHSDAHAALDAVLEFDPVVEGATSRLTNDQVLEAMSDQSQDQAQEMSQTATATNAGNAQDVTINDVRPDDITIKNVPNVYSPSIQATTSCFKPITGGVGWAGFGASGGSGVIDEGCEKRELIRLAYAMGAISRALFMWCKQPEVIEDFGTAEDCLVFEVAQRPIIVSSADETDEPIPETTYEVTGAEVVATPEPGVTLLAEVSQEVFDKREEDVDQKIAELKERAARADRRAARAEQAIEAEREQQQIAADELQALRALLREDYERVKSKSDG